MANLRLISINVIDSTTIEARFTSNLDPLINTSSVEIAPNEVNVPTPEVLSVSFRGDTITIKMQPLTPMAAYFVTFKSTSTSIFKSRDGSSFLLEDGNTNVKMILGAEDASNPVRDYLIDLLKNNVFSLQHGTVVRDILNSQAEILSRALYDIRQARNDNYLSHLISNEIKTRGSGPYDRLDEEGAYEILRVGKNPQNANLSGATNFSSFPTGVVSLQSAIIASESLVAGTGDGTFDKLVLTVAYEPVIKVNSITFQYSGGSTQTYDIATYGYRLKNSRYDEDYASTLLTLEDNQIELSTEILDAGISLPGAGDTIIISYNYKSLGKIIDADTVAVTQVLTATRESVPPITNQFTLKYFPIVTSNDILAVSGGVTFLDPDAYPPFSAIHPAFDHEIPYRFERLPGSPGEYSVDYSTGTVYVYGEVTNDGTGNYPPTATYNYRKSYVEDLDYTYDDTTYELVASPLRQLATEVVKISYDYEQTLVPDIDFVAQIHTEVIDERIENRFHTFNSVSVENAPITNVFRVYNETSGEIYTATRWNRDQIYFSYINPPNTGNAVRERASFTNVFNETLILDSEFHNSYGVRIFKFILENGYIFGASEDCIASSINSSATFSRHDVFRHELYFDAQVLTPTDNINKLGIGRYQIDYRNGVVYVGVSASHIPDVGTINYKAGIIAPEHSHVIGVSQIYHSLSSIKGIAKRITYSSAGEGAITPSSFDVSDERFLNGDMTHPYVVVSGAITVTDDIKGVRGIYGAYDLYNSMTLTDFSSGCTFVDNVITLDPDGIEKTSSAIVGAGLIIAVPTVTPGAEIVGVTSVKRLSDDVELWDSHGTFSVAFITLSGSTGTPVVGDVVMVTYNIQLNAWATPVVDYDRGEYYVDYSYLADEILVSYEYGDNVLDFRQSDALDEGDQYYVTYRVGALRDALLKNFGTLVDVPIMNDFDTTLARERYRDALIGALQSFTKGPTLPAIETLVSSITHIKPNIIEAAFVLWSLGISYLYPDAIDYTDGVRLMPGKFDNGILVDQDGYTVSFQAVGTLRLEEGTWESWVIPEWNGLDNDATLTMNILKDGSVLSPSNIYIGADSHHPTYDLSNNFFVNKSDKSSPIGLPSAVWTATNGVFVYYDEDAKKWKLLAKDYVGFKAFDGYHWRDGYVYSGTVKSSGEVYDVKNIPGLLEITDVLRSDMSQIYFEFHFDGRDVVSPDGYNDIFIDGYNWDGYIPGDGYVPGYSFDGIMFMADDPHYLFDLGQTESTNRFSIFKDGRGYLNFRVFDRGDPITGRKNQFVVSTDISDWLAGRLHHVATSWKLNTSDRRDELHLFVDGEEVPNIMRYGGRPLATSHDRFRTVKPEIVAGTVPKRTITYNDLHTVAGSDIVISDTIDFAAEGILPGDTLTILEIGFTTYTILFVAANILTLNANMPATLSDARFSVNQYTVVVSTRLGVSSNLAVSIISGTTETEIPGLRAALPGYSISTNALNQDVFTLLGDAQAGDKIAIRTLGLNYRRSRERHYAWGSTSSVFKTQLPSPIDLSEAEIYAVPFPLTPIGPDNAVLLAGRFIAAGLLASQPTNNAEGRTLSVRITGENVNFANPPTVTIFGLLAGGPGSETITFTHAMTKHTTNKFLTITSITAEATPFIATKNSIAVEVKETYSMTLSEGNIIFPVIRYSYQLMFGNSLECTGSNVVTDNNAYFTDNMVGQLLIVTSPAGAAGSYTIVSRIDTTSITVSPTPAIPFTGGSYSIYSVTFANSGFQNGFFTLETVGTGGTPFPINQGWYEFDYAAYLEVPFDPICDVQAHVGSDMNNHNPAKAIIDELRILSRQISDVRIGETLATNEKSVTTDYTALRQFRADEDTLTLIHFNSLPPTNDADFWVSAKKEYIQSAISVNSEFGHCAVIRDTPIVVNNEGLLSTTSEGTIEFWVSPRFDTQNDPNTRFYFDASGANEELVTSLSNATAQVSASVASIISVRLQTDTDNVGTNYFDGGHIESDFKTLHLGTVLPAQKTPIKIAYIPSGLSGDRISIFKDSNGYITFNVRANGTDYQLKQPTYWSRDTWHRIVVTYKFNRSDNLDEIRLFVDGLEGGTILFGTGLIFGMGAIFGQSFAGVNNSALIQDINFSDPINQFYIGSDYLRAHPAEARIDNLKISDIARRPLVVGGQSIDINYSSNINSVYPVVEDLYTTYLLNFGEVSYKNTDFALLRDEVYGIFNFEIQILDSFKYVLNSAKVQQILEDLIAELKPAQSKVTLTYIR